MSVAGVASVGNDFNGNQREEVVTLSEMAMEEGATCRSPMNRRRDEVGLRSGVVGVVAVVSPGLLHVAD